MRLRLFLFLGFMLSFLPATWAATGGGSPSTKPTETLARGIELSVDGRVVTQSDVDARILFALFAAGLSDTAEVRRSLRPQILDLMIDEILQLQKAGDFHAVVSEDDIQEAVLEFERQRGMAPGAVEAFLQKKGVSKELVWQHFKAKILLSEMLRLVYQGDFDIGDKDIEAYRAQIRALKEERAREVFELYLPIYDEKDAVRIRAEAEQLAKKIQAGASFQALAQEFSKAASAARGGSIGEVALSRVNPLFAEALKDTKPGQVAGPVRLPQGYTLLMYRFPPTEVIQILQVSVPLPPFPQDDPQFYFEAQWRAKTLQGLRSKKGCAAVREAVTKTFGQASTLMTSGMMDPEQLPKEVRKLLSSTQDERLTEAVPTPDGFVAFCVCQRRSLASKDPSKDEARLALVNQRWTQREQRFLKELRSKAIIVRAPSLSTL